MANSEERDYAFSSVCYSYREIKAGKLTENDLSSLEKALESQRIDLESCEVRGENIVFFAVESYAPAVLKFLLDNGATLDVRDSKGRTPIKAVDDLIRDTIKMRGSGSVMHDLAVNLLMVMEESGIDPDSVRN
jgi:hypothetical protein